MPIHPDMPPKNMTGSMVLVQSGSGVISSLNHITTKVTNTSDFWAASLISIMESEGRYAAVACDQSKLAAKDPVWVDGPTTVRVCINA